MTRPHLETRQIVLEDFDGLRHTGGQLCPRSSLRPEEGAHFDSPQAETRK